MMHKIIKRSRGVLLALSLLLIMAAGPVSAATYNLCAGETTLAMPGGVTVTVWGFGMDTGGACAPTIPGPTLRVDPTDPQLIVNLRNELPERISLHILGQPLLTNNGPVWDNGGTGARPNSTARVRSFSHEAAANGGTAEYRWGSGASPFKVGSRSLQSATNPAKHVQMGLSAQVIKDAATKVAYADNPGIPGNQSVPYDQEVILVFQEIDPAIHAAVAAGTYGEGGTITSSAYREPTYFLINGMAWPNAGLDPVNAALPMFTGERTLLRFFNQGGETHTPQVLNNYMSLVAEDGIPLKYAREIYGLELNPAKTLDTVLTPSAQGKIPLLDGRLNLNNAGASPGGMLAFLNVQPAIDTVTIISVTYDEALDRLAVAATSSAQPGATLTAVGYGALIWRAGISQYTNGFTGVTAKPASVTVTSSGGGSATYTFPVDTVTINSVTYNAVTQRLVVAATSSAQPGVALTAVGYGPLIWRATLAQYTNGFTGVLTQPASVTVTSSGGGSATMVLP